MNLWHQVMYLLGLTDANAWPYLMWSGVFAHAALPIIAIGWWRRNYQCHDQDCRKWFGTHSHHGHHYCKAHLP